MVESVIGGIARRYGLSHAALNALAVIEGAGGPMLTGEVATAMHVTSGSMTSVLDTLERKGYVVRSADPEDRRRVWVDVTPEAQHVLDALLPRVSQAATLVTTPLDAAARRKLLDALAAVRAAIAELPADLAEPEPRRRPEHLTRNPPPG
jgi:DNA-binding MarR family transcriptional regulator